MDNKTKKILIGLIVGICVMGIVVIVLGIFKKEPEVVISAPKCTLSESIFDSQNTTYVQEESFTKVHNFTGVPYTIDTVMVDGVSIGNGYVYTAANYYLYYSEMNKDESVSDIVKAELSQVLSFGVAPEDCTIETLESGKGYVNGFAAEYRVEHINVPGAGVPDAYVILYHLSVSDDDELEDTRDIILGAMTTVYSNETMNDCKGLLDVDIFTIQYSEDLAKALLRAKKNEQLDAENAEIVEDVAVDSTEIVSEDLTEETTEMHEGEMASAEEPNALIDENGVVETDSDEQVLAVLLKNDYEDLTIAVSWENNEIFPSLSMEVERDGVVEEVKPDITMNGTATFHVGSLNSGVYMVNVTNCKDSGTFSYKLIDNTLVASPDVENVPLDAEDSSEVVESEDVVNE